MSTLLWIAVAVALIWVVWKLSRSAGSSDGDGDSGTTFFAADGGGTGASSEADCSDSGSDGGSCDGGGDGGGGD